MENVFEMEISEELIRRINLLTPTTQPLWGKMDVAQMIAHINVAYEHVYDNIHPKPKGFQKLIYRLIVKKIVVSKKPFEKNTRTSPEFVITGDRDFVTEKTRLINYIYKTQDLGESHFNGKESKAFGRLSAEEWSNMFYKQLDHHLGQFGV